MKKRLLLVFSILALIVGSYNSGFAAFPMAAEKTTTVATPVIVTTTNQHAQVKQNFFQKLCSRHYSAAEMIGLGILGLLALIFGGIGLILGAVGAAGAFGFGIVAIILGAIGMYMRSNYMMATLGLIFGIIAVVLALLV